MGAIDLDPRPVALLDGVRGGVALVRRADDRAAEVGDPTHGLAAQLDEPVAVVVLGEEQPVEPVADPDHVPAAIAGGERHRRMTALSPGASPPPVLIATRRIGCIRPDSTRRSGAARAASSSVHLATGRRRRVRIGHAASWSDPERTVSATTVLVLGTCPTSPSIPCSTRCRHRRTATGGARHAGRTPPRPCRPPVGVRRLDHVDHRRGCARGPRRRLRPTASVRRDRSVRPGVAGAHQGAARRAPATIDESWWRASFERALDRRAPFVDAADASELGYRVVNGENDGVPGLIVDRYADVLVVKLYTAALFAHLAAIVRTARVAGATVLTTAVVLRLARTVHAARPGGSPTATSSPGAGE